MDVTLASLVLHNILRSRSAESYMPDIPIDIEASDGSVTGGSWRSDNNIDYTQSLPATMSNRTTTSAQNIRKKFADHFYAKSLGNGTL